MNAEIITIGDELLIGQVVDTNSSWMGQELNKIGVDVVKKVTISDSETEILESVKEALKKVNLLFITGGLGPTKDDITKETLCKLFNTTLVYDEKVYENIKGVLRGKLALNRLNKGQAMVPKDCEVINNKIGTAPIMWFEHEGKIIVSMPGVPHEMKMAMREDIIPKIAERFHDDFILHETLWVKNYPESELATTLSSFESELPESVKLAYLPTIGIIRLRLTAKGKEREKLQAILTVQVDKLKAILGRSIFCDKDIAVAKITSDLLKQKMLSVSTAESCTGGTIAAQLTQYEGASSFYKGGVVAYSNEVKEQLLGVKSETLNEFGAVSEEVVVEMVNGLKQVFNTDCCIATSGVAGPGGGTEEKPVGTVWIAVCYRDNVKTYKETINRGRKLNIERACNNALLMLNELVEE